MCIIKILLKKIVKMKIVKPMLSNTIRNISIENSVIKINDNNELNLEFSIQKIQKIYLKAHKSNFYLIYWSTIILLSSIIFLLFSFKIVIGFIIISLFLMLITKFALNKKKYSLYIKLSDNTKIYSIHFPTKRKEEILNIIWKIRKHQFEMN